MYSTEGGVDIESVAENTPNLIFYEEVNPSIGLMPNQARKVAFNLGLSGVSLKNMIKFISSLYDAYIKSDASLLEINPVLKTSDNKIIAVDSKMVIDDNSIFRHNSYADLRDESEENPVETEARSVGFNYVDLDGNIGCMVNGAGLAMGTMDIIKLHGGSPANFLDVGGGATPEKIVKAFKLISMDEKVKVILVNIFAGINRCDWVAEGIVQALQKIEIKVPLVIRLAGTNVEKGNKILKESKINYIEANTLEDAANKAVKALGN